MNKSVLAILFVVLSAPFSPLSFGKADYAVTWSVSGINGVGEMQLEFTQGSQFFSAVGIISGIGSEPTAAPLSGSCFVTTTNALNCSFFIGFANTGVLVINLEDFSGVWRTFDGQGTLSETGQLTFKSLN